jgi:hypothetical protein
MADGSNASERRASLGKDDAQADGKGAFVRTSNRLTGADRGCSSPCARDISPISSGGWSVNPVP